MPSLFDTQTSESILLRIHQLNSMSQRLWGEMTVSQMLAHLTGVLQIATGEIKPKATIMGLLMGKLIKKIALGEKPYKPNLPTSKEFIFSEDKDFTIEKDRLLHTLNAFITNGKAFCEGKFHPVFGNLNADEWGLCQWKHFDHHLRQFGV